MPRPASRKETCPAGDYASATTPDHEVQVWWPQDWGEPTIYEWLISHPSCLAIAPDGQRAAGGNGGQAIIWDLDGNGGLMTATITASTRAAPAETVADLLEQLGGIAPSRVRLRPAPGSATEQDLLDILDRTGVICELIDGVLVEKVTGFSEGNLALWIGTFLNLYLMEHDLGLLGGPDSTMKLMPRLVRIPYVSFTRWEKFPSRHLPRQRVPELVPDLAIEVLSEGNTPEEMQRKLHDYFTAGVEVVWFVDPAQREVRVYADAETFTTLAPGDTLDGGTVLPGFTLAVARIFERLPDPEPEPEPAPKPKRRKKM